jgi:GNAT superfamily N-acetyltransferase
MSRPTRPSTPEDVMIHSDLTAATAAEHRNDLLRAATRDRRTRTGYPVTIRRATPGDRDALHRFLTRLSPHSSFQRFFGGGFRATDAMLDVLLCRDGTGTAVVAVAAHRIVGHVMWAPARGTPAAADVAVAVDEDYRRQGLATRLVHAVVANAASRGIQTLEASVLVDNDATHRLVRRLWPGAPSIVDQEVVEYRLPLPQVTTARAPVLVRAATGVDRSALRTFLESLSGPTTFRRFLGPGFRASEPMLDLLMATHLPGTAMVAAAGTRIVGHGVWNPVPSIAGRAELAVVVADDWQRRGIGTRLMLAALADAIRHQINEVEVPAVPADDQVVRRMVRRSQRGDIRQVTRRADETTYLVALRPVANPAALRTA